MLVRGPDLTNGVLLVPGGLAVDVEAEAILVYRNALPSGVTGSKVRPEDEERELEKKFHAGHGVGSDTGSPLLNSVVIPAGPGDGS